jgi:hypothetical protein
MKKILSLLLAVGTCFSISAALASCDRETPTEREHEYDTAWSQNDIYHWHACTDEDCDKTTDKAKHNWDDGVITEPPTSQAQGVKTFTCEVCKYTKTEPVPYVPNHQVSQERWIESFDPTLLNNVTLNGQIVDPENLAIPMKIMVENEKSYEYMKFSETNSLESYYEYMDDYYTVYRKRSTWTNWEKDENYDFGYNGQVFLALMPLTDKYMEFTFNEETQCYEAGEMHCESLAFGTLHYESVVMKFEDGKVISISAKMLFSFKISIGGTDIMEYAFNFSDYGTTTVDIESIKALV